jgi:hypothetical protein
MKKLSLIMLLSVLLMLMASCGSADPEKPVDSGAAAGADETSATSTDETTAAGMVGKDTPAADETTAAVTPPVSAPAEKLTMSVKEGSVSPSGATVVFTNDSYAEFDTGTYYLLEKFDGNKWRKVKTIIENYAWEDIAIILPPGQATERAEEWEWLYGKLSPGKYRINKDFRYSRAPGDYDEYPISAEFEIV